MRRRILPLVEWALLVAVTVATTRAIVVALKGPPPASPIIGVGPSVTITKAAGGAGTLDVEAIARIGDPLRDRSLSWSMRVGRTAGPRREVVWESSGLKSSLVPRGLLRTRSYSEHTTLPPGDYWVEVSIAEFIHDGKPGARTGPMRGNRNPGTYTIAADVARVVIR